MGIDVAAIVHFPPDSWQAVGDKISWFEEGALLFERNLFREAGIQTPDLPHGWFSTDVPGDAAGMTPSRARPPLPSTTAYFRTAESVLLWFGSDCILAVLPMRWEVFLQDPYKSLCVRYMSRLLKLFGGDEGVLVADDSAAVAAFRTGLSYDKILASDQERDSIEDISYFEMKDANGKYTDWGYSGYWRFSPRSD